MKFERIKISVKTGSIVFDDADKVILHGIITGKPIKQMADEVCLSFRTVEGRISSMLKHLKARSRTELVLIAISMGVISYEVKKDERPPAIYSNTTPYGIANN